jgi:hypothetical protein
MNNFDAKNPEHVATAMAKLYEQVALLEQSKIQQAEHNTQLANRIQELTASSQAPAIRSQATLTPKLPLPEKYDGKRHSFRQFINTVKLHFSVSPDRFPSDAAKTGFVASLLRGPALDWITPYLEQQDSMLSSWTEFESKFKAMFDDPHRSKTAVAKLTQLRQGRRPVVVYAAEFRRIVMDADFDNNAQAYWFRAGLADSILDELTHTAAETDLEKLIAQCVLIDTRLREREVERSRRPMMQPPPRSANAPVPMVLDSATTPAPRGPLSPEERKRRVENDLCLYCGRAGHRKASCPSKSGNGQARQQRS